MTSRRPSPNHKRVLALKRADGEPLGRADIQYDVLNAIMSNKTAAFTDPYAPKVDDGDRPKLTFRDLYIKAMLLSGKLSKAVKDKMAESPAYAEDFAMLAILVNVGRVNTTMSFFPETRTSIRTYHPVPCLLRTRGNLQDAPRIKHILKASFLEDESSAPPTTPEDILARARAGHIPSTSVTNLLFVLSTHATAIATHFSQRFDFLDVFLKQELSSSSRAQAFLWLCFNYLENPGSDTDDYDVEELPNPFAEPTKNTAPPLIPLTPEEVALENVDTPDELTLKEELVANRDVIVKKNAAKDKINEPAHGGTEVFSVSTLLAPEPEAPPAKGRRKGRQLGAADNTEKPKRTPRKTAAEKASPMKGQLKSEVAQTLPPLPTPAQVDDMNVDGEDADQHLPNGHLSVAKLASTSTIRDMPVEHKPSHSRHNRRYSPYPHDGEDDVPLQRPPRARPGATNKNTLQYAWEGINMTDPLVDSDNEITDTREHHDYTAQRVKVMSNLSRIQWAAPPLALRRAVEVPYL